MALSFGCALSIATRSGQSGVQSLPGLFADSGGSPRFQRRRLARVSEQRQLEHLQGGRAACSAFRFGARR